jgi:uncharacterized membrane protein YdjX (TVP38/TMEM64 family)
VRVFVVYTAARLVLFAAVFGAIWLFVGRSVEWNAANGLYTALIAMVISSLIAFLVLRSLRDKVAFALADRVQRAKAAAEARRTAEDDD